MCAGGRGGKGRKNPVLLVLGEVIVLLVEAHLRARGVREGSEGVVEGDTIIIRRGRQGTLDTLREREMKQP